MKILVVGSGGREYGLVWAARQSKQVSEVLAVPGNAGMAELARCIPILPDNIEGLVQLACQERPDLVLIGPELPLSLGLTDRLTKEGIPVFGPTAEAARLESSKAFAKEFMDRHSIPTAKYRVCETMEAAEAVLDDFGLPIVIKADGLAGGKGVTVAETREQAMKAIGAAMQEQVFGEAGKRVVIEECLQGEEASVQAFTDSRIVVPVLSAQDHKRINEGDQGPNTGGMGAYAPAPVMTPELIERVKIEILEPTVAGMAAEGRPYKGILYAGLMITADGPKVIEYNCRFGDPETQVVLPLLGSDLIDVALACIQERLGPEQVKRKPGTAVCVVLAAPGYPGSYPKGLPISGLEAALAVPDIMIWHAGTAQKEDQLVTDGGRVLNVIAVAPDIATAVKKVYSAAEKISFAGVHYRQDIAYRALKRDKK
ncbi:phosphoribosylamine--glycine ligase [bacterium]|nr:phosphoribosylamine--glycine ligase [bacterium]